MSGLTRTQHAQLLTAVHPSRVAKLRGMAHLEAWDVRRWLIRIFGFTGWSFEVVETALVYESVVPRGEDKVRATVVYRATGRLRIRDTDGNELAVFEDAATGDGVNMPSVGDAHDFALKTAVSQALKRCAANLGDQFGLSLYNNGSTEPVVQRVLAAAPERQPGQPSEMPNDPPVVANDEAARIAAQQDADAEESQDPPLGATPEQVNRILAALKAKRLNLNAARATISEHAGRKVGGPADLTAAEADQVLEKLTATLPAEAEQQPEPPAAKAKPKQATGAQLTALNTALGKIGITERNARISWASGQVGRQLGSTKDLTPAEASALINALHANEQRNTPLVDRMAAAMRAAQSSEELADHSEWMWKSHEAGQLSRAEVSKLQDISLERENQLAQTARAAA